MTTAFSPSLQAISPKELQQLDPQTVMLIDVREPVEFAGEHIPGATSMPLSRFEAGGISSAERPLVLYCQSGNRSAIAAQKLFAAGVNQVTHLEGGLSAWKRAGYPTVINRKAPISLMRQVQIVAGSLVVVGTLLGAFVSPWFLILSGFVGSGLVFAGVSDTCILGMLLAKLSYNQV